MDATAALQDLLDQVETQRLGHGAGSDTRVREARGVYAACLEAVAIERDAW